MNRSAEMSQFKCSCLNRATIHAMSAGRDRPTAQSESRGACVGLSWIENRRNVQFRHLGRRRKGRDTDTVSGRGKGDRGTIRGRPPLLRPCGSVWPSRLHRPTASFPGSIHVQARFVRRIGPQFFMAVNSYRVTSKNSTEPEFEALRGQFGVRPSRRAQASRIDVVNLAPWSSRSAHRFQSFPL
jgi:hypothetical protein